MTGGLFAILDDIATLLDDAAVMSKVAAKKAAGLLGDDLAVNAEKATGFRPSRELPVLWAITKGSLLNKIIILPVALLLSAFLPWLIAPILLLGGTYLCFEGAEKIYHHFRRHHEEEKRFGKTDSQQDQERRKIKAAVRTDFILSIEIVMITLGTVVGHAILTQLIVVSVIALAATIGVYGLVALIVRMDDVGFYLIDRSKDLSGSLKSLARASGSLLIAALPKIIRLLGIVGTIAMFLVGGGMFTHHIQYLHHLLEHYPALPSDFAVGLVVGACALGLVKLFEGGYHSFKSA